MKAVFTDRDGNTTIKEITPPPKPVVMMAVPEDIAKIGMIPDGGSFDIIPQQTFQSTRFDLLGVESDVAYYVEHDANQAMAQIVTLTSAFKLMHPEIDKGFEAEMAAEMEKSPPLGNQSMQDYLQWIYERVKVNRDKQAWTAKTSKPPKPLDPIVASKFDDVLKMMGLTGVAGKFDVPFVTSTQAVTPHMFGVTHIEQNVFQNIMDAHPTTPVVVKPKIVKPKKPPIVPPPRGRMIAKRKA